MTKMAEIRNGIVTNVAVVPEGEPPSHMVSWVSCPDSVGPGWSHDGVNFSAPPAPTPAELENEVQELADRVTQGTDRDKAIALTIADMWRAQNPGMTVQEARVAVRDRIVHHLRAMKGL